MRIYEAARLFMNFFQPSFNLASKTRVEPRRKIETIDPQPPA